jgi:hypothetical protein
MPSFTETIVEDAALSWLEALGYVVAVRLRTAWPRPSLERPGRLDGIAAHARGS